MVPIDWTLRREDGRAIAGWTGDWSSAFPWGRTRGTEELRFEVADDDPAHASAWGEAVTEVDLPGRALRWRGVIDLSGDETTFRYRYTRELLVERRARAHADVGGTGPPRPPVDSRRLSSSLAEIRLASARSPTC